ncbi:MAG: hypothetical protein H6Q89_3695, partial [Myxococcaceae bacterium]|nr:hypothetical protein [Myxococcaceae bacterium]
PLGCVGYEIDDLDTALCVTHERPSAPQILTSRGQVLEGNAFAVSGNVLWRLASFGGASGIERLEDDGTAFRATHRVLTAFATAGAVVADGDEAWVLGSATTSSGSLSLLHLTPEQDGGIAIQSTAVPGTAAAGVALGKDAALLFTGPWQMALATRDGGLVALEDTGHLVGADPEVLWLEDNADPLAEPNQRSGAQNLKVAWAGQGELRTPMLQLPRRCFLNPRHRIHFGAPLVPMSAVSGGPEAPVGSFAVPRFSGAQISLENFDAGTEFAPVSAVTRRHAFARALDGSALKIFERSDSWAAPETAGATDGVTPISAPRRSTTRGPSST